MKYPRYVYEDITILEVNDGDSLEASMNFGHHTGHTPATRYRFARIDAPEMRGTTREAARAAKAFLESLVLAGAPVRIETVKPPRSSRDYPDTDIYSR